MEVERCPGVGADVGGLAGGGEVGEDGEAERGEGFEVDGAGGDAAGGERGGREDDCLWLRYFQPLQFSEPLVELGNRAGVEVGEVEGAGFEGGGGRRDCAERRG